MRWFMRFAFCLYSYFTQHPNIFGFVEVGLIVFNRLKELKRGSRANVAKGWCDLN